MAAAEKDLSLELNEHYLRLALRAIHGDLNVWGKWIEEHADYHGFPRSNILESYIGGSGGGSGGHRINCDDMPDRLWVTHHRVLLLVPEQQDAVGAYYIVRVKPDGTLWSLAEKCLVLGIAERTLRDHLRQARLRILGL